MDNETMMELAKMPEMERNKMFRKRKLLEKYMREHPYKISLQSDGRYHTYLPTKPNRTHISKKTMDEIKEAIFEFNFNKDSSPTFEKVFALYIKENIDVAGWSEATEIRYTNIFNKFYYDDEFNMAYEKIEEITEAELYIFIKTMIRKYKLTIKVFQGLRTITKGMYIYAKSEINANVFSISQFFKDRDFHMKAMKANSKKHSEEEMIFSDKEYEMIRGYCLENLYIQNIGILIAFETGVRIGELSSLEYSDFLKIIEDGEVYYYMNVSKTETRSKEHSYKVKDNTKTEAGVRKIVISEFAYDLAQKAREINPNGEYLLMTQNGTVRQRGGYLNKRLYRICDKLGIVKKSSHKMRRYYATSLLNEINDESLIKEQMGHSDIATTRGYYYFCNKGLKERRDAINKALNKR